MKAEKHPERIKYVLNGNAHYYTENELWKYLWEYYDKNDAELTPEGFEEILERLRQYDGDPYGGFPEEEREFYHSLETKGFMYSIS